jgi:hypothetical protein
VTSPQEPEELERSDKGGCGTEASFGCVVLLWIGYLIAVALETFFSGSGPSEPLK